MGAAETAVKKQHDHEEFARFKQHYNNLFGTLFTRFAKDMAPPEEGPNVVRPDVAALRAKVEGEWRETVARAHASSVPLDLDPEALTNHIDGYLRHVDMDQRRQMPLHAAGDLSDFGLTSLGRTPGGNTVWLSHEVGVVVGPNGRTGVLLRGALEPTTDWLDLPWLDDDSMDAGVALLTHWTVGELYALLTALRLKHVTSLSAEEVARAQAGHTDREVPEAGKRFRP